MSFYNQSNLFRRKDDITGKEIFSEFPPEAPNKVYEKDYWWSDAWDAMEYGKEYDFSRPFFEQFRELMLAVPWPSRNVSNIINSDYSNQAGDLKNCYLCFNISASEDSAYVIDAAYQKNCYDVTTSMYDELSYDSMAIRNCYQMAFSYFCEKCRDVWFSRDCAGCSNCFGCVNLRNKQYHIFNKPYTKEAYEEEIKRFDLGSWSALSRIKKEVEKFLLRSPRKFMTSWRNANVSGDMIAYSKNLRHCYNVVEVEDSAYCQDIVLGVKDSYDFTIWGEKCELMYEVSGSGRNCRNLKFTVDCWPADRDVEYSVRSASSSNLFGCVGLRSKSYCILNKQYSEDEYFALRDKIVKHMNDAPYINAQGRTYRYGEFFPPSFSLHAYNSTLAHDFFPLSKDEAVKKGYLWRDPEMREYQTTLDAKDLPDHIRDVSDSILKEVVKCGSCLKAYRIIPTELEFYRKRSLPLPRLCVNCRFRERVKHRNPPRFYKRKCQCAGAKSDNGVYVNQTTHFHNAGHCPNEFETSYLPDRPEIVYCEQCYQAEVV
ncbi:hypothetical protein HY504_01880 [Candidatus Wolfebacteria bacterium]|nr:hypothetical protein [Candidatus Wolfebacteria bacterium]